MLTQQEQEFIRYWETNRLRRKKVFHQFLVGIPVGLLFVIPIVINFASGWYKRARMEANSEDFNPMVLMVALLLIVGFTAIFYQRHKWDQYEQRYRELLARKQAPDPSSAAPSAGPVDPPQPIGSPNRVAPSDPIGLSNPIDPSKPAPQTDFPEKSTVN
jgi:hypothetical protein